MLDQTSNVTWHYTQPRLDASAPSADQARSPCAAASVPPQRTTVPPASRGSSSGPGGAAAPQGQPIGCDCLYPLRWAQVAAQLAPPDRPWKRANKRPSIIRSQRLSADI